MFFKKKKIAAYLKEKKMLSVFDECLADYLSGNLKKHLNEHGMEKISLHVDWLKDYRCIDVQGKYGRFSIEMQIEENEFSIAADADEPEHYCCYPLKTKSFLFEKLEECLKTA